MSFKHYQRVPVVMYHSIGVYNPAWRWKFLTCPVDKFESHLKWLRRFGFSSISLEQLYNYIFNNNQIPPKSIILTFDDGYLDNWIYAYPLLKKYGFKGVIFINPEFVDSRPIKRTRMDQVEDGQELETCGFLSWDEVRAMEQDGIMDIQSHAMTHTWYPVSNKIVDFRHPCDPYIWMSWNQDTANKPYLQIENEHEIRLGTPVYEHDKALSKPIFFNDPLLSEHLVEYVKENGTEHFFYQKDWRKLLYHQVEEYVSQNLISERIESIPEYSSRILWELKSSKEIIEYQLNKKVEFLCWPGGSATTTGRQIASQIGYKMTTIGRDLDKRQKKKISNSPDQKINIINRFAAYPDLGGLALLIRTIAFKKLLFSRSVLHYSLLLYHTIYNKIVAH